MTIPTALHDDPVLRAAFDAFTRYGYQRTTMSDVAAGAGMSRPAVYLRVANKDALLRNIAAALLSVSLDHARAAAGADTSLTERVDGVLQAKLAVTLDLAERSPHALELLGHYHRLAAAESDEYMHRIEELVAELLAETGAGSERSADLAAALTQAVVGLEQYLARPDTARRLLSELVSAAVAGLPASSGAAREASGSSQ